MRRSTPEAWFAPWRKQKPVSPLPLTASGCRNSWDRRRRSDIGRSIRSMLENDPSKPIPRDRFGRPRPTGPLTYSGAYGYLRSALDGGEPIKASDALVLVGLWRRARALGRAWLDAYQPGDPSYLPHDAETMYAVLQLRRERWGRYYCETTDDGMPLDVAGAYGWLGGAHAHG